MTKQLVLTADDYGLHSSIDEAILDCVAKGSITNISIVTNAPSFPDAANQLKALRNCSFGIHLNLSDGNPLTDVEKLSPLLDASGSFKKSHVKTAIAISRKNSNLLFAIETEWRAQIERVMNQQLPILQLASHGHIHLHPVLFPLVEKLARDFDIPFIRTVNEECTLRDWTLHPIRALKASVLNNLSQRNQVVSNSKEKLCPTQGILDSGRMNISSFEKGLLKIDENLSEFIFHPGKANETLGAEFAWKYQWEKEYSLLTDQKTETLLHENKIIKTPFIRRSM